MSNAVVRAPRVRRTVPAWFGVFLVVLNLAAWAWIAQRSTLAAGPPVGTRIPALGVAAVLPSRGVESTDRLSVVLDAPLVGPGEALPAAQEAPFTLDPPVPGAWRMTSPNTFTFQLGEPLGLEAVVRATPTQALERLAGRPVRADWGAEWRAADNAVQRVAFLERGDEVSRARLVLSAPMAPEALGPRLVGIGCTVLEVESVEASDRPVVRFTLDPGHDGRIGFALKPRVPAPIEDSPALAVAFTDIPRGFTVVDTDADVFDTRAGGAVTLTFNAALEPSQEAPRVTVTPSVGKLATRVRRSELVVEGAFEPETDYVIEVAADVVSVDGETPRGALRKAFRTPRRYPRLNLAYGEGVLGPHGHLTLPLSSVGVERVRVRVEELLPGNVVQHLFRAPRRTTSRETVSRVFDVVPDPDGGVLARQALDLRSLLEDTANGVLGTYAVTVEDVASSWRDDTALLTVTDLTATVRRDARGVHAWVTSLSGGEPVADAEVSLYTLTDQVLGVARTGSDGHACIAVDADAAVGEPYALLVRKGADLAHQRLTGARWDVPHEVVRGRRAPVGTDVFLYPERNLYRPGDPVHLTGIVRTDAGLVNAGARLTLEVERPDGQIVSTERVAPEPDQALFHALFETTADARTGTWQARVRDGATGRVVGRARFGVEAFLPARLEVTASRPAAEGTVEPRVRVEARALAGTRVDGFPARATIAWTPRTYRSDAFPGFTFERAPWAVDFERQPDETVVETTLDGDGAAEAVIVPPAGQAPGLWSARATWAVTEPGGRTRTARNAPVPVDTAALRAGVRVGPVAGAAFDPAAPGAPAVRYDTPFAVEVVALDPSDAPVALDHAAVEIAHVEWSWELRDTGGRTTWQRVEHVDVVWSGTCTLEDGRGAVTAVSDRAGEHRVTVRAAGAPAPTGAVFHTTAGDPARFVAPLGDEGLVEVTPSVRRAEPGARVAVELRAPFDGTALVFLEDETVRAFQRVDVVDGRATVTFEVPADTRGGVAIAAQITRPVERGAEVWLPHRAYGWARVGTDHDAQRTALAVEAPPRVRPGDTAHVVVRADEGVPAGSRLHLWAVDEGIRIAGGHTAPDPHGHFFGERSRGRLVTTDSWFHLMPDLDVPGRIGRIGGDAEGAARARHAAPERVHTEPGVVWLESVPVPADGVVEFDVATPGFTGELTWMATLAAGERFGAAQAATTLAAEVPLLASLPRFVAPGDRFQLPVRVENRGTSTVEATLELELEGPARRSDVSVVRPVEAALRAPEGSFAFELGESVALAPGERATCWVELEATGAGRIGGAFALDGAFVDGRAVTERISLDVPVRSGRPRATVARTLAFDVADAPAWIDVAAQTGLTDVENARVRVSPDPGLGLLPLGHYLASYPYGCAEQTASRVLAHLAFPALLGGDDDEARARAESADRVRVGLGRLATMVRPGGGLAYWPGPGGVSTWATAWAAECVARAESAGADVPAELRPAIEEHLGRVLETSGVDRAQRIECALGLARLGRVPNGWLRRFEELAGELTDSERAAVAAALACAGEDERALALIDGAPWDASRADGAPSWRPLRSRVRAQALLLEALLRVAPEDPRVQDIAAALDRRAGARGGRFANTVDNASALGALAAYRAAWADVAADWTVTLDGESVRSTDGGGAVDLGAAPVALTVEGSGRVFAFLEADGRAAADAEARRDRIELSRRLTDASGAEVDPADLEVGQLLYVDLEVLALEGDVPSCVLVDPLPGGFEVERPELAQLPSSDESTLRRGTPERVEFLDDRVLVFDRALERGARYRYAVRVVSAGTFEHAPAAIESMYRPEIGATSGLARPVVVRR